MLHVSFIDEIFVAFLNSVLFHHKSAGVLLAFSLQVQKIVGFVRGVNK